MSDKRLGNHEEDGMIEPDPCNMLLSHTHTHPGTSRQSRHNRHTGWEGGSKGTNSSLTHLTYSSLPAWCNLINYAEMVEGQATVAWRTWPATPSSLQQAHFKPQLCRRVVSMYHTKYVHELQCFASAFLPPVGNELGFDICRLSGSLVDHVII